jgi:hypothetical protein
MEAGMRRGDLKQLNFRARPADLERIKTIQLIIAEAFPVSEPTQTEAIRYALLRASTQSDKPAGAQINPDERFMRLDQGEPQPAEPLVFDPDAVEAEAEPEPAVPLVLDPDAVLKAEAEPAVPEGKAQRPKRKPAAKARKRKPAA